ncbi:MAG: hypothetical protein IIC22_09430, partial [Chloroflexi bacterium]|nr:hypothetical protein [Chloroflexota bacterium]
MMTPIQWALLSLEATLVATRRGTASGLASIRGRDAGERSRALNAEIPRRLPGQHHDDDCFREARGACETARCHLGSSGAASVADTAGQGRLIAQAQAGGDGVYVGASA